MKHISRLVLLCAAFTLPLSSWAASLSGVVTDRTTGQPAAGDTVSLLSTAQGLQELARTTSGPDGRFSIDAPGSGIHLLRVSHANIAYYTVVQADVTTANLDVYDSTPSKTGLRVEADVMHVEASGQTASIVETLIVDNTSKPAHTQFAPAGFELSLPQGAQPTAASATGPSKVTEPLTPMRQGSNGPWSLVYPIRPGETQLEIDYSLPWNSGSFAFHPTPSLPTSNFAVMLPNSMKFTGAAFHPINQDPSYQTFLFEKPAPGKAIDFTLSGTGTIPTPGQNSQDQNSQDQSAQNPDQSAPGGGLGAPIDTPGPLYHSKWLILSGLSLLFVAVAAFGLRRRPRPAPAALTPTAPRRPSDQSPAARQPKPLSPGSDSGGPFLLALREEFFHLESDRAQGRVTPAEYAEAKSALDLLLTRALSHTRDEELVHS